MGRPAAPPFPPPPTALAQINAPLPRSPPPNPPEKKQTAPAILWVGFNILSPLTNQLGRMNEMKDDAELSTGAGSRKRR